MFEGLDLIDWARLTDAYGGAEVIPPLIRKLASREASACKDAIRELDGRICHQGSRYRASAPAVPFLFEALDDPGMPARGDLIELLVQLAIGYNEGHLPLGFDPSRAFAEAETLAQSTDLDAVRAAPPTEDDDCDPGLISLWEKDAYEAVLQGIDMFRRLTEDNDESVRRAAIQALAWFPAAAADSAPLIRGIARGSRSPDETADAVICLGLLDRSFDDRSDVAWLEGLLATTHPAVVRSAAAIALGTILGKASPQAVLSELLDAVEGGNAPAAASRWSTFGVAAHASMVIEAIRPEPTEEVVSALCRAAQSIDAGARAQVWWTLLSLVFPDPKPIGFREGPEAKTLGRIIYLDPAGLALEQTRAMRAVLGNPIWERHDSLNDQHMDILSSFGLPWDRERLRGLVESAEAAAGGDATSAT